MRHQRSSCDSGSSCCSLSLPLHSLPSLRPRDTGRISTFSVGCRLIQTRPSTSTGLSVPGVITLLLTRNDGLRSKLSTGSLSRSILLSDIGGTWRILGEKSPTSHLALTTSSALYDKRKIRPLTVCTLSDPSPALILLARIPHDHSCPTLYLRW